jgi:glycosyltransferase involved in cell wall biosynthesis
LGLRTANLVVFQYAAAADEIFDQELAIRYRHKFQTIIPGIDLAALEPLAAHRKAKPREDNPPFVILQVGTICDRKNQALTIEALRLADKGGWDNHWELWLAYDEIQDPDFEQRLLEQGLEDNVKLLGWRNDVKELMVRANILVMPSKDEGVPNAVQEAMAIGLPVLVSSSGGMPEIIVDGKTGWILDVDDPTAWAQQIHWCRDNLNANEAIGQNASAFAFKYFSTDHWGAEYARIIAEQLSHQLSKGKH